MKVFSLLKGMIVGIILFLFFPSFSVFFVQDDFFLLNISQAKKVREFLSFFIPLKETVWYRPLSSQVFFFFGQKIFGFNPFPYHIVVFITHVATAFLLFRFIYFLTKQKTVSMFSAIFYSLHAIHTVSLSWLAAYSFIVGPFFIVSALLLYIQNNYRLSFVLFILGILSTEVLVLFPLILLFYQFFVEGRVSLWRLYPFILMSIFILVLRFVLFPSEISSDLYNVSISLQFFATFKFYIIRLFGIPMIVQSMPSGLRFILFIMLFLFAGALLCGLIIGIHNLKSKNIFMFFGILAFVGLAPFLILPQHISPHYLSFSLLGIAPLFAYMLVYAASVFSKKARCIYLVFVLLIFVSFQAIGVFWTYQTHWIFRRADVAKKLVMEKNLVHPVGSEEYFALGANAAQKVFNINSY